MSEETNDARAIGRLEGTVGGLQTQVTAMDSKLDTVVAYIEQQKGAKRAWGLVGTVGGAVAGAVVSYFTGGIKP